MKGCTLDARGSMDNRYEGSPEERVCEASEEISVV